ncbi:hypothetical protein PHYBOEH_009634 [Phytophthora boehmeriae]|uniref:Transferase n=1 Tax=Phytophthora boehmeriae TaxID=109152 RepID=A0A8T1VSH4_9STRA|nr:hypothetical protein PHYBOEH_009634 [Phytophthora boehmeriae]
MVDTQADDDQLFPLSPMDAVMHSFGFIILYIFPPQSTGDYDLNKLHRSFITLVDEDYPFLVGELHVDPQTGIVNVNQTSERRQRGAQGIRFETNPNNSMTTDEAIEARSWDLMPTPRGKTELICAKGTLLSDGGLVIGVDATHTLFDGEAMFTFMAVWGQHYSGVSKEKRLVVNHDRHLLKGTGSPSRMAHPEFRVVEPEAAKEDDASDQAADKSAPVPPATEHFLFHFSPAMMKKIKGVATQGEGGEAEYVSTNDAITALFTVLVSRARGHGQDVRITTGVNSRRRLDPPLPENYVGNVIFNAFSAYTSSELKAEDEKKPGWVSPATLAKLARRVRASILMRNDEYLRDAMDFLMEQKNVSAVQVGTNFVFGPDLMFTSWVHMGMYNAEFDGVHPWYACAPQIPGYDGFNMITEARKGGDGVDVGVFLESAAMERLKKLYTEVDYLHE